MVAKDLWLDKSDLEQRGNVAGKLIRDYSVKKIDDKIRIYLGVGTRKHHRMIKEELIAMIGEPMHYNDEKDTLTFEYDENNDFWEDDKAEATKNFEKYLSILLESNFEKETSFEVVDFSVFRAQMTQYGLKECKAYYLDLLINLPRRATPNSAAYDFIAYKDFRLNPGETITVPSGVKVGLGRSAFLAIYPNTKLSIEQAISLKEKILIITGDYYHNLFTNGHIIIRLENCSNEEQIIRKGQSYVQGIAHFYMTFDEAEYY